MRKKAIKIINYSTDILLSSLFLLILAGTFVFTLSMNPVSWQSKQGQSDEVLGVNSIGNTLKISDTSNKNAFFKLREFTDDKENLQYKLEVGSTLKGSYTSDLLEIVNGTTDVGVVTLALSDTSNIVSDNDYYIEFDGERYSLFDKQSNTFKTYEIDVLSNTDLDVMLYAVVDTFKIEVDTLVVNVSIN